MNIRELRFKVRIATAALSILCLAALAALIFMYTEANRQEQLFGSLHSQIQNSKGALVPPQTVDDRVKEARTEISQFYDERFPATASAVFVELGKLASANRVSLNQAQYKSDDTGMEGVQQVSIKASLSGDYGQVMKFINALERDRMFFIIDGVSLGDQNGGNVRLNLGVETFMRGGAQ